MRALKLLHRILKFINYANFFKINEKCYFSVISWPILILFVLSDRAWCGLQNFYTEFRNSLIMQIYANLFKINEKCYFVISWPIQNSLIMQIYSKINEKCYMYIFVLLCHFLADFDSVWFI